MWNPEEKEFIAKHPEVFEEATSPERLKNHIESFVNYHWLRAPALVIAWAELKGEYSLGLAFRLDKDRNNIGDLYLTNGLSKYKMLSFYANPGFSQASFTEQVKSKLNEIGLNPVEKMIPNLWKGLEKVINRG